MRNLRACGALSDWIAIACFQLVDQNIKNHLLLLIAGGVAGNTCNDDLFGLNGKQQTTPVSQPKEAPVAAVGNGPGKGAATGRPVHTSSDPADVRAFLHGSAGASGLNVSKWDTADEELVKRAEVFSR